MQSSGHSSTTQYTINSQGYPQPQPQPPSPPHSESIMSGYQGASYPLPGSNPPGWTYHPFGGTQSFSSQVNQAFPIPFLHSNSINPDINYSHQALPSEVYAPEEELLRFLSSPQTRQYLSLSLPEVPPVHHPSGLLSASPSAGSCILPMPPPTTPERLFSLYERSPYSAASSSSPSSSSSPTLTPNVILTSPLIGTTTLSTNGGGGGGGGYGALPYQNFISDSFPSDSDDHYLKRDALAQVMTASWKVNNEMEPHESLLLQFMRLDASTNRWTCCFHTGGATGTGGQQPCGSSYKKKDQAKGHVRFHLQHFPFACLDVGPCPIKGAACRKRYCAAEPRQKHRAVKIRCEECKKPMLRGNLKRHLETACSRQQGHTSSTATNYSSSPVSSTVSTPPPPHE
ncbi:hypothetical protein FRC15_001888 [Serendipita sp. 397]|nr:hypothetical protein FRC15_001888 [Serendipita sp. 397]